MITTNDDVRAELQFLFGLARDQLLDAKWNQRQKDTAAHRAAVDECRAHIDAVLDVLLDLNGTITYPADLSRPAGARPNQPYRPADGRTPGRCPPRETEFAPEGAGPSRRRTNREGAS